MNKLRKKRFYGSLSLFLTSMVLATSAMGLIFLAPVVAYKYMKKYKGYEARAVMPVAAEKVYSAAVSAAEEKAPKIQIVKKEDENMLLEVTDGIQTASVTVKKAAEEEGKSELTVLATIPKEEGQEKDVRKEKEKELAHRVIHLLCTKLEVECTLTKE
ncbi:MAG: hypothetical protein EHM54_03605 [Nitrospiraceae bacterium]|nr:MAG: hypothetical protein EHM54_03605 [Nitrospiraceae bacterium]